mmetsp:Transcript_6753/g.16584  ORF Transcript_6753/g.16584 Transcript_6753/m.16584 type:complete len:696 (+) Transcript_6753:61-2148(+)
MMVPRLLLPTCLLPKLASSSFLWRENDTAPSPVPAFDEATAAAIAEREALYLSLKDDYLKEGCNELWGDFPSKTTPAGISVDSIDLNGGRVCKCGMIYDLASSAFFDENDLLSENEPAIGAEAPERPSDGVAYASTTPMTKLESWVLARTDHSYTPCSGGSAAGFPCENVDLVAHLPLSSFMTTNTREVPRLASDVWGWTSSDEREFVIWGIREGHYFLEVTDSEPLLLGFLPTTSFDGLALQHDVKVLGDFAYLGSEGDNHGIQIFDLTRLLAIDPGTDCVSDLYCQELHPDRMYHGSKEFPIEYSHNVVVNKDNPNAVYVVGSESCNGGLHVIDVSDPLNPTPGGCFGEDSYVHDAHCVDYIGPDSEYVGREICFCFDEDTVTIVDVTDKSNMQMISKTGYEGYEYTHQGWLSTDQSHLVFGDEIDEYKDSALNTKTLVMNVEDLTNPSNVQAYYGSSNAVDHNQYVVQATAEGQGYFNMADTDLIYQANYKAGLRILQVLDYETADFVEVGHFDTFPLDDDNKFEGAWTAFPYFRSGLVVISSIEEGLFLVRPNLETSLVGYDECSDDENYRYQDKSRKSCEWVANSKNRHFKRKKCKKTWLEEPVWHYCRETCGEAGLGYRQCQTREEKGRNGNRNGNGTSNAAASSFQTAEAVSIEANEAAGTDAGFGHRHRKPRRKYVRSEADENIIPM